MNDETSSEVKMYNILCEAIKSGAMSLFVIANEEDKRMFSKYSEISKLYFLSRPVSLFTLYEKLIYIETELKEMKKDSSAFIEEYDTLRKAGMPEKSPIRG